MMFKVTLAHDNNMLIVTPDILGPTAEMGLKIQTHSYTHLSIRQ